MTSFKRLNRAIGPAPTVMFRTIDINQLPVGALDIAANSGANANALRSYGVNYTFSRLPDDTASGVKQVTVGGSPQDNYNALAGYGLSENEIPGDAEAGRMCSPTYRKPWQLMENV